MKSYFQKFKKTIVLITASSVLLVATGSSELLLGTPSAELNSSPSAVLNSTPSATSIDEIPAASPSSREAVISPINTLSASERLLYVGGEKNFKMDPTEDYILGEIIVHFKESTPDVERANIINRVDGKIARVTESKSRIVKVEEGKELEMLDRLKNNPHIEYAELNAVRKLLEGSGGGNTGCYPNDEKYCTGKQSYLARMHVPNGWTLSHGSSDTVIAILDTGVNYNHPDLKNKMWVNTDEIPNNGKDDDHNGKYDDYRGWDFIGNPDPDNDPMDDPEFGGHGTFVAGIAAAQTNNTTGIAGVNWHAKIMPVRVVGTSNTTQGEMVAQGIMYAVENGADVINISIAGSRYTQEEKNAVEYARINGVVIVAGTAYQANWQDHNCFIGLPAGYPGVISVAALNSRSTLSATCSNLSKSGRNYQKLQTSAPGEYIYSTNVDGSTTSMGYDSGPHTSWATPIVSGIAAYLYSCGGGSSYTYEAKLNTLRYGGADFDSGGWDSTYGYSTADLYRQLDYICF